MKNRVAVAVLVTALVVGMAGWLWGIDYWREQQAREAIDLAVDACTSGSQMELARRYVDARAAIRKVPVDRQIELDALMESKMHLILCK